MKFRPLSDRVLIKRDPSEEITRGGIIIPENAQQISTKGTVVAVGPGRWTSDRRPVGVRVGDRVIFAKYAGDLIFLGREDFSIMREDEILGVLEE